MADIKAILQRCDPALLDPSADLEQQDCAEAPGMVLYLTDSRRVQKVLCRQLFALDSMMSLLEGLNSAQQLITTPCPSLPDGAWSRWKALKVENRTGVEETETLLGVLQEKIQQILERRQKLTQLVQHLQNRMQQHEQLVKSLKTAQNALESCDSELTRLRAESEAVLSLLMGWQRLRDKLQVHISAAQDVRINLLSFNQSELCVELRPHPSSDQSSTELEPLRLTITWSRDDHFRLQVNEGSAGLVEDCRTGRRSELGAALLEVMQCYMGQYELLSEIQGLRSSFAIDWRPAQRLLVYLKSALLVCHIVVEEGYPSSGKARLLSVQRDGQPVDTSGLKPHKPDFSLTDWLVLLCSSPLI